MCVHTLRRASNDGPHGIDGDRTASLSGAIAAAYCMPAPPEPDMTAYSPVRATWERLHQGRPACCRAAGKSAGRSWRPGAASAADGRADDDRTQSCGRSARPAVLDLPCGFVSTTRIEGALEAAWGKADRVCRVRRGPSLQFRPTGDAITPHSSISSRALSNAKRRQDLT